MTVVDIRGETRIYDMSLWSDKIALAYRFDGILSCATEFYRQNQPINVTYKLARDVFERVMRDGFYTIHVNNPEIVSEFDRAPYYETWEALVKDLNRRSTRIAKRPTHKAELNLRTFDAALWAPVFVDLGTYGGEAGATVSHVDTSIRFTYPSDLPFAHGAMIPAPPLPRRFLPWNPR